MNHSRIKLLEIHQWMTLIVVLGTIALWLTSNLALATFLCATHASIPALQTGLWIWRYERSEHEFARARVLLLFYVADAGWLMIASGISTLFGLSIINGWFGWAVDKQQLLATLLAILVGFAITNLVGLCATYLAMKHRIRVWVHHATYRWCAGSAGRLRTLRFENLKTNHGKFILFNALIVPCLLIGTLVLIALIGNGQRLTGWNNFGAFMVMLSYFLLQPICAIFAYGMLSDRVLAIDPSDCWGPDSYGPDSYSPDSYSPGSSGRGEHPR